MENSDVQYNLKGGAVILIFLYDGDAKHLSVKLYFCLLLTYIDSLEGFLSSCVFCLIQSACYQIVV